MVEFSPLGENKMPCRGRCLHRPAGFAANASVPGRYGIRPYGITHSKPFLTVSPLFFDHAAAGGVPYLLFLIYYFLFEKTALHQIRCRAERLFYCSFALMAASIARAASLPAPMARMTVAAPVTASPPA